MGHGGEIATDCAHRRSRTAARGGTASRIKEDVQRALLRAILGALVVMAVGPVGIAMAGLPPIVVGITPSEGSTAGGTAVTINGTGFLAPATVTIGAPASEVEVISETEIKAKTAPGAAGLAEVVVSDENGPSLLGPFYNYVTPPPTVTKIEPSSGSTVGGTSVTITGTNLTGASEVKFGSTKALPPPRTPPVKSKSKARPARAPSM